MRSKKSLCDVILLKDSKVLFYVGDEPPHGDPLSHVKIIRRGCQAHGSGFVEHFFASFIEPQGEYIYRSPDVRLVSNSITDLGGKVKAYRAYLKSSFDVMLAELRREAGVE